MDKINKEDYKKLSNKITDEFKEILSEPWMAKQMHIALQHTSPKMLDIMNRRNKM
jgi:tRNA A37 methylthiotransferase MiaB